MKRQLVKSLTMVMVIATVAFVTSVVSANAQGTIQVKANVPFEFVVGNEMLPAGEYTVRSATSSGQALIIQSDDASHAIYRLSNTIRPKTDDGEARLVFHRYGQNYFLKQVWEGGDTSGREVLESKQEKAIKREQKALAQNRYEIVEIVATLQ
jgi:hypothetical protein